MPIEVHFLDCTDTQKFTAKKDTSSISSIKPKFDDYFFVEFCTSCEPEIVLPVLEIKSKQKQFHDCNSCKELIVNIWLNWRSYGYVLYLFSCIENWIIEDFWSPEKNLSNHNYVHPPAAKKTGFYGPIEQRKNKIKYVRALNIGM